MPVHTTSVGMERKLAAILSADVQGYSRLMGEDEEATIRTLTASREITDSLIHQHRGRVVNTAGDSVLAEFTSAVDAVQCAVEIQQGLKAKNAELPVERQMAFRIGINVGDVVAQGEDLYGDGVNVAARLQALADAGGIFIAGTVYDQVRNKLALNYEYLGEQSVKNIANPVRVYRVVMEPEAVVASELALRQAQHERGPAPVTLSPSKGGRQTHWMGIARLPRIVGLAGIGVLLLAGVIIGVQYVSFRLPTPSANIPPTQPAALPLPDKPSIAVLPFKNMSNDPDQDNFRDGMMEDLITDLSKLPRLVVIAHHSAFLYKGKEVKVQEVSRELGVRYVLEGSVRKAGDHMLITAQLIDGTTGGHVWAERYERPLQDLFVVQEEVRRKILVHLGLKLTPEEHARLERVYTRSLEAHSYYLRGFESGFRGTPTNNLQARQWCEKAIALDPTYTPAYVVLGMNIAVAWASQWNHDPQALEQAFTLAQKALALDSSHPHAHELLAVVYLWRDRLHEQALAENTQALVHGPNWFSAHVIQGTILNFMGRPEETIALADQALRLSPQSLHYLFPLGNAYRLTRRYEEALAAYKKVLAVMPHHSVAHSGLAAVYSELGREEEAKAEAAEVLRINPQFSLEALQQRLPYKDPAELERHLAALRKAGLK